MSFDAYAECPSFFAQNELEKNSLKNVPNIESENNFDDNSNIKEKINESIINQHYAQPYIENTIVGKPMFSLHRHIQASTIPCLAIDGLALETIFRMMKIQFNVRHDVEKGHKPAYINHEGYLLTGIKKVLHYLNLRSKLGVDSHLTSKENAIVRSFSMLIIDQTSFIVDFYRYHENYDSWKNVVHDASNKSAIKNMKTKRKSHKIICQKMLNLGFYNWCEEGIKSVAKEDFKSLSILLGNKKYFMGDIPCVLDCISFALISNLIHCKHINPLVALLKTEFTNLTVHCERIKSLFWPDWNKNVLIKTKPTHKSWSFSYKRFSFRHNHNRNRDGNNRNKSLSNRKPKPGDTTPIKPESTEIPISNKNLNQDLKSIELTTKSDLENEPTLADNKKVDLKGNIENAAKDAVNNNELKKVKKESEKEKNKETKKESKISGVSSVHSLGLKCSKLLNGKLKPKIQKKKQNVELKPVVNANNDEKFQSGSNTPINNSIDNKNPFENEKNSELETIEQSVSPIATAPNTSPTNSQETTDSPSVIKTQIKKNPISKDESKDKSKEISKDISKNISKNIFKDKSKEISKNISKDISKDDEANKTDDENYIDAHESLNIDQQNSNIPQENV